MRKELPTFLLDLCNISKLRILRKISITSNIAELVLCSCFCLTYLSSFLIIKCGRSLTPSLFLFAAQYDRHYRYHFLGFMIRPRLDFECFLFLYRRYHLDLFNIPVLLVLPVVAFFLHPATGFLTTFLVPALLSNTK